VGADQVAEIRPGIKEVLEAGEGWCATFEAAHDASLWVQYGSAVLNAGYPHIDEPNGAFSLFEGLTLVE
jgi:hypothetical protein